MQSGIQTQWNIWDGVFNKNSWRAVPVNNFRKKIHLIFHLRGSEFDSDLKHSGKKYIYLTMDILHILCCKSHLAVRRFMKTFRKIAGKRLWWKPFLANFKLFKIDSGKGVFLSVFQTPFYGCFETFNRNAFLRMIIMFGENNTD